MTDLTASDRQEIATRVYEAWGAQAAPAAAELAVPAEIAGVDPRKWLCENWDLIIGVLKALAGMLPPPAGLLIGLIITAANAAKPKICPVG